MNENAKKPVVSVIVVTFNQDLERLIETLDSIVIQENIPFEIILCDDGSQTRFDKELKNYFEEKNFSNYTLVFHDNNVGTVSNYFDGLIEAKGKYTKLFGPGDCLAEKGTLSRWVRYLEESGSVWSFSDTYYYRKENGKNIFFKTNTHPQLIQPYITKNDTACIWNYTALFDGANGAAILGRKDCQLYFCRTIKEKGIRYCEDYIYRLMMFKGIVGCYFPETAVCYEYGPGVSTSGSKKWSEILGKDRERLIQIMQEEKNATVLQKNIVKACMKGMKKGKYRKLFIRGKLLYWLKYHLHPRLTPLPE